MIIVLIKDIVNKNVQFQTVIRQSRLDSENSTCSSIFDHVSILHSSLLKLPFNDSSVTFNQEFKVDFEIISERITTQRKLHHDFFMSCAFEITFEIQDQMKQTKARD